MRLELPHDLPSAAPVPLSRALDVIQRRLQHIRWSPADLPRPLQLEWRFVVVRWFGIVCLGPLIPFMPLGPQHRLAALAILAVAAVYNLAIQVLLHRRPALLGGGYVTMLGDALLIIAAVGLTGGCDAPFSSLMFPYIVGTAMRFGYGPSLAIALLFAGFDVVEDLHQWPFPQPLAAFTALRAGVLSLTAVLASHLRAHERGAEAALQDAYAELATSHQELLEVEKMRSSFLANVSHELRTPLSSIRAVSELLLTYDDPAVRREFLQIVNAESERLTRLVNDVLDATRIESGRVAWHVGTVDVAALVGESARTFAPLAEQQGVAFELDVAAGLPPVTGDRDRLYQVVGNLLNNALKFTPAGTIRLSASCVEGEVRVAVADTGIGIAAVDHGRIFEKFQQVGTALTGKPRGTGLGLAICREIVAHHKGRVWVESEPGRGSTFTFAVAAAAGPVAALAVRSTPAVPLTA